MRKLGVPPWLKKPPNWASTGPGSNIIDHSPSASPRRFKGLRSAPSIRTFLCIVWVYTACQDIYCRILVLWVPGWYLCIYEYTHYVYELISIDRVCQHVSVSNDIAWWTMTCFLKCATHTHHMPATGSAKIPKHLLLHRSWPEDNRVDLFARNTFRKSKSWSSRAHE